MKCPFLSYYRYYSGSGVGWRMKRKLMARGVGPGAYQTKGKHWRIRRPRGVTDRDIALWLHPETGQPRNTNFAHCEPLKLWIDTLRQRIIDHRYDHQPGRPRVKPAPAHPA